MHQGFARSVVYRWFTSDAARALHPPEDQEAVGRRFVASARVAYTRDGTASRAAQIVRALLDTSPQFTSLWKDHDVAQPVEMSKRIVHPKLGLLDLHCQNLYDPAQLHTLIVFTAEPGSVSHAKLAALCADPESHRRDGGVDRNLIAGSPIRG